MPHLRRHHRLGLTLWLVVALLFTQLASAAYACPRTGGMAEAGQSEAAPAMMVMVDMPDCDGMMAMDLPDGPAAMDPAQPQLCKLHCSPASQTVQAHPVLDAPGAPQLLAVLNWAPTARLQDPGLALSSWQHKASGAAPPGALPRYLTLLVLRH